MPAPPSSSQKAANQASMNAAKAKSGATQGSMSGKVSGGTVGGSGGGVGGMAGASANLQRQLGLGGVGGMAGASANLQRQLGGLLGGGGNQIGGMLGNMNLPGSANMGPLTQEAMRRSIAQGLVNQYKQYQSPPGLDTRKDWNDLIFKPDEPGSVSGKLTINQHTLGNMNPPHSLTPRTAGTTYQGEGMPGGWGQQAFEGGPAAPSSLGMQAPGNMNPPHTPTPNREGYTPSPFSNPMRHIPGAPGANAATSGEYLAQNFGQAPQQQSTIFNRFPSDAQLSNPAFTSPGAAMNRAVVQGVEALGLPKTAKGNMQAVDEAYKALGFTDQQRAAMLGRNAVETGNFDPAVMSGARMGDAGLAFGLGQWHPDRLSGVKNTVAGTGASIKSPAAQAVGLANEMYGPERQAYDMLREAQTPLQGQQAMNRFERQQGWNTNAPLGQQTAIKFAQNYLGNMPERPTQVAAQTGAAPQTMADNAPSLWESMAPASLQDKAAQAAELVKAGYATYTDANKKIEKYGGAENVVRLAKMADAIRNFLPGGPGSRGATKNTDQRGQGFYKKDKDKGTDTPATPPVTPPTVNPTPPMWYYPQYTQAWANLPTGLGGPVWKPKPPSAGLFAAKDETKDGRKKRGAVA